MMEVIKVEKHGMQAEIPLKLANAIKMMDKHTFCIAYLKKDEFHQEIMEEHGKTEDDNYMKDQLDTFFEIEKRRRNITGIGGDI